MTTPLDLNYYRGLAGDSPFAQEEAIRTLCAEVERLRNEKGADSLMRAAALCRGVAGKAYAQFCEQRPASKSAETLADMEAGARLCVSVIEAAIASLSPNAAAPKDKL